MSLKNIIYRLSFFGGRIIGHLCAPLDKAVGVLSSARTSFRTGRLQGKFASFGKESTLGKGLVILNPQNITIGSHTNFQRGCVIESYHFQYMKEGGSMIIGDNCNFGEYTHITTTNKIVIGNGVLTGRFVLISDNTHGRADYSDLNLRPEEREVTSKGPIVIEDNVWLGDKVAIMPGVRIGEGAILAANAVVTKDIPAYSIAAGVPAKIIKEICL